MFAELPKIFDKNFALSYFFPSLVFIILSKYVLLVAGIDQNILPYLNGEPVNDLSILALFSYLGGIILLISNKEIYRFLEGYGKYHPLKAFEFEKKRYRNIIQEVEKLDNEYYSPNFTPEARKRRTELMHKLSAEFPDKEELVLPTSFGNVIRSFEVYPRVMYGIEYIDSWSRLQAVMPGDFRGLIDDAKARTDLWVNFQFAAVVIAIQAGELSFLKQSWILFCLSIIFLLLSYICGQHATACAFDWGDYAKSSFDIFMPKLREALGFPEPKNRKEEKAQWLRFSQAIIFRLPEHIPEYRRSDTPTSRPSQKRKPKTEVSKNRKN